MHIQYLHIAQRVDKDQFHRDFVVLSKSDQLHILRCPDHMMVHNILDLQYDQFCTVILWSRWSSHNLVNEKLFYLAK